MKILIRRYGSQPYVWKTAKYDGNYFIVDGEIIYENNIVSVINDNRKNYGKCSSCGKMFPKNGKKFRKHQELSSGISPCLECRKLRESECSPPTKKFFANADGTYKERYERDVRLYCHYSSWTSFDLNSEQALETCMLRQCGKARQLEIVDTFTQYPGVFDDIITVDKLLDKGYGHRLCSDQSGTTYVIDDMLGLYAYVNEFGILDKFIIDGYAGYYNLWYSKKYGKLFTDNGYEKYDEWRSSYDEDEKREVENYIRELYE